MAHTEYNDGDQVTGWLSEGIAERTEHEDRMDDEIAHSNADVVENIESLEVAENIKLVEGMLSNDGVAETSVIFVFE